MIVDSIVDLFFTIANEMPLVKHITWCITIWSLWNNCNVKLWEVDIDEAAASIRQYVAMSFHRWQWTKFHQASRYKSHCKQRFN